MAKLYAELSSDKAGRPVSRGGDTRLQTRYKVGNHPHVTIIVTSSSIVISDDRNGARVVYHPDRTQ